MYAAFDTAGSWYLQNALHPLRDGLDTSIRFPLWKRSGGSAGSFCRSATGSTPGSSRTSIPAIYPVRTLPAHLTRFLFPAARSPLRSPPRSSPQDIWDFRVQTAWPSRRPKTCRKNLLRSSHRCSAHSPSYFPSCPLHRPDSLHNKRGSPFSIPSLIISIISSSSLFGICLTRFRYSALAL